jgi:C-terminal processing protease CtpA/Prc
MSRIASMFVVCCLVSEVCLAQSAGTNSANQLKQGAAQANELYQKHQYSESAALLEKLAADPAITALPDWPDTLYNLACDQALAGQAGKALATLEQAFYYGTTITADHLETDSDLASLHNEPAFKEIVAHATREEAIWKDNPALATGYKPVLTEEEKVAGLSKFWSEARFNFPFFGRLPGMDWDGLYMQYLAKVRDAKTTADYYRVMMQFAAALKDSHTNVYAPRELFDVLYATPGIRTALIESKVIVTSVMDPALRSAGWKVGDAILKIDDRDVREYAETEVEPYVSASTSQDRDVRTFIYSLLAGNLNRPIVLTVEDATGKREVWRVVRPPVKEGEAFWKLPGAEFRLLPGNFAYLAINEFEDDSGLKTLLDHLPEIQSAKGLILDVRQNGGGNTQNSNSILQVLASTPFLWERERTPKYRAVYRAVGFPQGWEAFDQFAFPPDAQHHLGLPVAVLTSAATFSTAEDFVAMFGAMHRGIIVGEPTGGSTGQPFSFKLPGGGSARICTKDTRAPDGKVFEGVGIQPQVAVKPSIEDIRTGKDAALNRAVEILSSGGTAH